MIKKEHENKMIAQEKWKAILLNLRYDRFFF
jgi:hypothetical protein